MRRFALLILLFLVLVATLGAGVALGVHWAGLGNGVHVSFDGEPVAGPAAAIAIGGVAALVAGVVAICVVAALASVAILVPVALALALVAALVAAVIGLSPLLVPVLLVVGACVLLSRRSERRRVSSAAPPGTPSTPDCTA